MNTWLKFIVTMLIVILLIMGAVILLIDYFFQTKKDSIITEDKIDKMAEIYEKYYLYPYQTEKRDSDVLQINPEDIATFDMDISLPEDVILEQIMTDTFIFGIGNLHEISIGPKEMASMSVEELHNLTILINLGSRLYPSKESDIIMILGVKLLPRFFIKDYQE